MNNPYKLHISNHSAHFHIIDAIGENKRVLDVGCNDGYIGKLANKNNEFYGLDNFSPSVKIAKKIYKDAIVYDLDNLRQLPWIKKFDIMIFGDVLEHTKDPEKILKFFIKNYLNKNGVVIISLPNIANYQIRLQLLMGNFDSTDSGILDKTHLHFYTFKTARKLVFNSKLKVLRDIGGTRRFWWLIQILPFLKELLSINIVLICKYD